MWCVNLWCYLLFPFCRVLVEQLEKVNLNQMENNAQTAFWINMYNSLVMHVKDFKADNFYFYFVILSLQFYTPWSYVFLLWLIQAYLAYGIPHSSLRRLALFHKVVQFFVCYVGVCITVYIRIHTVTYCMLILHLSIWFCISLLLRLKLRVLLWLFHFF